MCGNQFHFIHINLATRVRFPILRLCVHFSYYPSTVVSTSSPSNEAELQLYRVLQRASLLAYYDTLLEMGGDDVQQLCDAGEEEFLEIMALVGMASKPLHVRRLQKSLHEWAMNPATFQTPLAHMESAAHSAFSPEHAPQSRSPFSPSQAYSPSSLSGSAGSNNPMSGSMFTGNIVVNQPIQLPQQQSMATSQFHVSQLSQHQQQQQQQQQSALQSASNQPSYASASSIAAQMTCPTGQNSNGSGGNNSANPTLTDSQMARLAAVAEE